LKALDLIESGGDLRQQLSLNANMFRSKMEKLGFTMVAGQHAIIPVMLGDARLAQEMAARMLELGVYVIGFSYPVVPEGKARIRTQMSAAHSAEDIEQAVGAFETAGRELGVI
jgi:glycine C-acetyltransferase